MHEKFTKDEIKHIMKNISRFVFIGDTKVHREKFRQIKINDKYIPYIISSFGRIFSVYYGKSYNYNVKELKSNISSKGYVKITIHYDNKHYNFWIHRLVASAFIKNKHNKNDVNHKDGIKTHNYVWNLEWTTRKENVYHAEINNLTHHPYGEQCFCKITEKTVINVCKMILQNRTPSEIKEKNNISTNMFQYILHQRKWKHITKLYDFSNYRYKRNRNKS